MIIIAGLAAAGLTVLLGGGDLSGLADLRFRHRHLVLTAFAIQIVVISIFADRVPVSISRSVHLYSYVLGLAFVVVNRRIAGLAPLALGAAANAAAIAANGGVMPASAWAERVAGVAPDAKFANSAVVAHPRLWVLGDVFALPRGWPLANVFSIGDVLIVVGAGLVLHHASGSRWTRRRAGHLDGEHELHDDAEAPARANRVGVDDLAVDRIRTEAAEVPPVDYFTRRADRLGTRDREIAGGLARSSRGKLPV